MSSVRCSCAPTPTASTGIASRARRRRTAPERALSAELLDSCLSWQPSLSCRALAHCTAVRGDGCGTSNTYHNTYHVAGISPAQGHCRARISYRNYSGSDSEQFATPEQHIVGLCRRCGAAGPHRMVIACWRKLSCSSPSYHPSDNHAKCDRLHCAVRADSVDVGATRPPPPRCARHLPHDGGGKHRCVPWLSSPIVGEVARSARGGSLPVRFNSTGSCSSVREIRHRHPLSDAPRGDPHRVSHWLSLRRQERCAAGCLSASRKQRNSQESAWRWAISRARWRERRGSR